MKHCPSCYQLFQKIGFDIDARPVLCLNCGWQGAEEALREFTADEWRAGRMKLAFLAAVHGDPLSGFGLLVPSAEPLTVQMTGSEEVDACDPATVVDAKGE